MKVLKKYFKVVLCFMAFALTSFMFAFTPSLTAVMAQSYTIAKYNTAINAIKMPTQVVDYSDKNAKFRIPLLENVLGSAANLTDNVDDYTIRVIDPTGTPHDYVVGRDKNHEEANDTTYFAEEFEVDANDNNKKYLICNAKNEGEYKIVYIIKTGSGDSARTYYSNTYTVTVKNVSYELDFTTPVYDTEDLDADGNTTEILGYENKLFKSKLQKSDVPYELPVVYAKVKDGDVTELAADIKVTKNGAPQVLNDTANSSIFKTGVENGKTKYYIVPNETGKYVIEYTFGNSLDCKPRQITIDVVESFEAGELKLVTKDPTFNEISLGKKDITLPTLTFNANSETNVGVNVKSIVIENETNSSIKYVLRNNNFKFDMTTENFGASSYADMRGNYIITYTVVDAYGKTATESFVVNGVTVTSKPTIQLAYDYDVTKANYKETVDLTAETELRTEYVQGNEIVLPAAYVTDDVTAGFGKFTIIRTIRKGSQYFYIDNKKYNETSGEFEDVDPSDLGYNAIAKDSNATAEDKAKIGDPTKAVKFKFNDNYTSTTGTYYLEYRVISNEVKANRGADLYKPGTSNKYTFEIVETGKHKATTPVVTIDNLDDTTVKSTDDISVKITATDDLDSRLLKTVFVYSSVKDSKTIEAAVTSAVGSADRSYSRTTSIFKTTEFKTAIEGLVNGYSPSTYNKDTNSYDLDLSTYEDDVYVAAVAVNDDGKVVVTSKKLTLKDTKNDKKEPTLTIKETNDDSKWLTIDGQNATITEFEVGQQVTVKLPTVYAYDEHDNELSLNVSYYIDSPENSNGVIDFRSPVGKDLDDYVVEVDKKYQVMKGGTITTSETGVYYVAYSATDAAGNTSVLYFTFKVKDTSKPILSVDIEGNDITQTGNTVTAKKGALIDFNTSLRSADGKTDYTSKEETSYDISIDTDGSELDWEIKEGKYVFNDYGTYVVTITGNNGTKDSDAKVIRIVVEKQSIEWIGEFDVPEYATKDSVVYLPKITAKNADKVSVKVTAPGGVTPTAGEAKEVTINGISYWAFTTNKDTKGSYTVTYTATSNEDILTKTFKIKVGDNVAPTMTYDKGDLTQSIVYDGENDIEYVIKVNRTTNNKSFVVEITNNGKTYTHNINLRIKDKDDTNIENTDYPWSNLTFKLVGDKVTEGEITSTSAQYFIKGTGKYSLQLTIKDSYDNEATETIDFKVVAESKVEEKNDLVVGVVLIIMSLILLAGVILFFVFTGKKGGSKSKKEKTTKNKQPKAKKVESKKEIVEVESKEETAEEVKEVEETKTETVKETEEVVEKAEETVETEQPKQVEESNNEPKEGEVE